MRNKLIVRNLPLDEDFNVLEVYLENIDKGVRVCALDSEGKSSYLLSIYDNGVVELYKSDLLELKLKKGLDVSKR